MNLYENDLLKILVKEKGFNSSGKDYENIYRVLFIDHGDSSIWWVHIFDDSLPEERTISDIELMISKGDCELYTNIDPWDKYPDVEVYDSDTVEVMKKKNKIEKIKNNRFDSIKEFVDDEPSIYTKKGRSKFYFSEKRNSKNNEEYMFVFVKYNAGENEISRKSFLKYLKHYWKRGKCEFALYPDFDKCGIPKKPSLQVGRKRGPKYFVDPEKGRAITPRDKRIFEKFIKSEILGKKKTFRNSSS